MPVIVIPEVAIKEIPTIAITVAIPVVLSPKMLPSIKKAAAMRANTNEK